MNEAARLAWAAAVAMHGSNCPITPVDHTADPILTEDETNTDKLIRARTWSQDDSRCGGRYNNHRPGCDCGFHFYRVTVLAAVPPATPDETVFKRVRSMGLHGARPLRVTEVWLTDAVDGSPPSPPAKDCRDHYIAGPEILILAWGAAALPLERADPGIISAMAARLNGRINDPKDTLARPTILHFGLDPVSGAPAPLPPIPRPAHAISATRLHLGSPAGTAPPAHTPTQRRAA